MQKTPALHHVPELGVVVVAAGRGERLGSAVPKAFVELCGTPLIEHTVRTVVSLPYPGHVVVVVPEGTAADMLDILGKVIPEGSTWSASVVPGGRERHESVRFGIEALGETIHTVLVHDAARPLTPADVFERVLQDAQQHRAAVIPVLPIADTVKRLSSDGLVVATVDRADLVAAQTPQGFPLDLLIAAHEHAQSRAQHSSDVLPTDDAEVVQRFGVAVRTVPGDPLAHKITTRSDLVMLEGVLRERADQ